MSTVTILLYAVTIFTFPARSSITFSLILNDKSPSPVIFQRDIVEDEVPVVCTKVFPITTLFGLLNSISALVVVADAIELVTSA